MNTFRQSPIPKISQLSHAHFLPSLPFSHRQRSLRMSSTAFTAPTASNSLTGRTKDRIERINICSIKTFIFASVSFPISNTTCGKRRTFQLLLSSSLKPAIPRPLGASDGVALLWLRGGDLRLRDSLPLVAACSRHSTVVPLYILRGDEKPGAIRALRALRKELRARKAELYVRNGNGSMAKNDNILSDFVAHFRIDTIHTMRTEDKLDDGDGGNIGSARLERHWDGFLRCPDSLKNKNGVVAPLELDQYEEMISSVKVPNALGIPEKIRMPVNSSHIRAGDIGIEFSGDGGGEADAWKILDGYIRGDKLTSVSADGAIDVTFGRLEESLRHGCISARSIYHEVRKRTRKNRCLKYFCAEMELVLRDFNNLRKLGLNNKSYQNVNHLAYR